MHSIAVKQYRDLFFPFAQTWPFIVRLWNRQHDSTINNIGGDQNIIVHCGASNSLVEICHRVLPPRCRPIFDQAITHLITQTYPIAQSVSRSELMDFIGDWVFLISERVLWVVRSGKSTLSNTIAACYHDTVGLSMEHYCCPDIQCVHLFP